MSLTLTVVKLVKDAGSVNMEDAIRRGGTWSPTPASGTVMTPSLWLRVSMTSVFITLVGGCPPHIGCGGGGRASGESGGQVTEEI